MTNGWRYYNHALLPTSAPHESVDIKSLEDGSIWRMWDGRIPLLARWTSNWDCGRETEWWYCIKDSPFDIDLIKSNYRYKIHKGERNFSVKRIDPMCFIDEICEVQCKAYAEYDSKYRPSNITRNKMVDGIKNNNRNGLVYYGAFGNIDCQLYAFMIVKYGKNHAELLVQKADPVAEKKQVNAALIYGVLKDMREMFNGEWYFFDGERNINHETNFQNYLIKYFGFRRAYCKLNIKYRPILYFGIKLLYPWRKIINRLDKYRYIHMLNSLLIMEDISRSFNKEKGFRNEC